MEAYIIGGLIVGFCIGASVQRWVIYMAIGKVNPTTCDYCEWKKENEWRWGKRKSRHAK